MAGGALRRDCENCNNQVEVSQFSYRCKFGEKVFKECQLDYPKEIKMCRKMSEIDRNLVFKKDRFVLLEGI